MPLVFQSVHCSDGRQLSGRVQGISMPLIQEALHLKDDAGGMCFLTLRHSSSASVRNIRASERRSSLFFSERKNTTSRSHTSDELSATSRSAIFCLQGRNS